MNYHNIKHDDQTNGDGIRVTLFVSGCSHRCPECQNEQTWRADSGIKFDDEALNELYHELCKDYISGITLSGGDPMFVVNRPSILALCYWVKKIFPDKTIWLYTGYTYEQLLNGDYATCKILSFVDVIVDGTYQKDLRDLSLPWRGSKNQRVINMNKTREAGKIVLHCD